MDLSANSGTLPTHTTVEGPVLEHELSVSSTRCQTESGGTILLQLLEFKTCLLEAVEELHIQRDAETRFEDQISKLVLEKQELEWEKESLQHQSETVANQHTESLNNVRKQFQAKIRNIEEEKGKYQVSAELKDKEINNLKEELKSLQLLKYNLEKKSSELEQKLALQSRSKDSHLNQLGEAEKRFSALSRQCAIVKQAHENLEQNVDEAMIINKKLSSANGKQEETIVSLKKELEEVSKKLIKAKMSSITHNKTHSATGREQRTQQLHQKLSMETEMNKKLGEENVAVRAEKQEVIRSLQHAQQLLLSQTQTLSKVELELQTQREQYQGLKQEHEVMREKNTAMEDKVAQLMESYSASKTSWDKEKVAFLGRIKTEQQDLQAVTEAYDELHQKHTELSSQARVQARHICDLEMRDSSQSLSASTQIFPTLVEEIGREETLNEPISSELELPGFDSLQHTASTQTKSPDSLEDTGAITTPAATGATGGLETPKHHQQSQFKQPLHLLNRFGCPLTNNNLFSLCRISGTTGSDGSILNKYIPNTNTSESDPEALSDLIYTSSASDDGLLISKGSCVSNTSTVPSHKSTEGSVDFLSKEKSDGGNEGMSEKEQGWNDDVKEGKINKEEEERDEEQQWSREEVRGEDVKEGGSSGEKRGTLIAQTADRREDSQRSTEDAADTKRPATETQDRAGGEGTDGVEKRGKTGLHTPETPGTQILAQMATDTTTEKSDSQVIGFMDTEPPPALSHKVVSSHVNKSNEIRREVHSLCPDEHQSVSHGPKSVMQEVQLTCQDQVQTFAESRTRLPSPVHETYDHPQSSTASLAAQSDGIVSIQKLETTAQTQPTILCDMTSDMKQIQEVCDTHASEDCALVRTVLEPQPQTQELSEQDSGQLKAAQEPVEKPNMKGACVDITTESKDADAEVETGSRQEHTETVKTEDAGGAKTTAHETVLKLSVHPNREDDASPETGSAKHHQQSPGTTMQLHDTIESSLPSDKNYSSSFDWGSAQKTTGSPMSEQNPSDPGGLLRHPASTMFLKSKHSYVPLVITRASDLFSASSVSGTAASTRRHQQGEWKSRGETATADVVSYRNRCEESRTSLSITSFPLSTSSITVSSLSWQTTPGCSRAPTSAAGPSAESDWEPSCSEEREEQQSSFRAQISKIEQFLNTERLRLPKRRRTDN